MMDPRVAEEEEDPTDIFDSSLSSLFSIPPIGFAPNSKDGYYTYHPPAPSPSSSGEVQDRTLDKSIKLKLPEPPSNLYTTLQAQLIWPSSIYLSDLISREIIDVRDKNVIELGSASGLPGIISLSKNANKVVSTDYGIKEVLDVLEDNFTRASGSQSPSSQVKGVENDTRSSRSKWKVLGHCWGEDVTELLGAISPNPTSNRDIVPIIQNNPSSTNHDDKSKTSQSKFDIIIAADVLWTTSSHSILLDSINALIDENGIAHITAGLHTGRGPVERFIQSAKERGFKVDYKGEVRLRGDGGWDEYSEGMAFKSEEERGVVVWFTLRK